MTELELLHKLNVGHYGLCTIEQLKKLEEYQHKKFLCIYCDTLQLADTICFTNIKSRDKFFVNKKLIIRINKNPNKHLIVGGTFNQYNYFRLEGLYLCSKKLGAVHCLSQYERI